MRCISVPEVPTIGTYARSVITSSERTEDSAAGCTKKLEERGSGSHSGLPAGISTFRTSRNRIEEKRNRIGEKRNRDRENRNGKRRDRSQSSRKVYR